MAIFLIILGALLFAIFAIGGHTWWQKYIMIPLSLIILIVPIGLMLANEQQHFGMKTEKVTTTHAIYPSTAMKGSNIKLLLFQPLGNGDETVYVYKTDPTQKKVTTTKADEKTTNTFEKSANTKTAHVVTTTTRYTYKNKFYETFFAGLNNNHQYKSQTNTFKVNKNWYVLSTKQAKALAKQSKAAKKTMAAQAKTVIAAQMKAALTKDPTMSKAQQKQLQAQIQQKITQQATAKTAQTLQKYEDQNK